MPRLGDLKRHRIDLWLLRAWACGGEWGKEEIAEECGASFRGDKNILKMTGVTVVCIS